MKRSLLGAVILGVTCWFAEQAMAQVVSSPPVTQTGQGNIDRQLADCLAVDSRAAIKMAQFGASRAQQDNVKEFAKRLQNDHNELVQRLSQVSPSVNTQPGTQPGTVANQTNRVLTSNESQMMAIKQEVANTCIQLFQEEMSSKSSKDFDRCFVGSQVGSHLHMLAALKVSEKHASPALASVVRDGISTIEDHLQDAKQILKGLESELARAEQGGDTRRS